MDLFNSMMSYIAFGGALAAAVAVGTKLLPMAEVLLMADLPEDSANEV